VVATWTPDQRAAHQRARGRERARRFRERKKDGGTAGDQDRDYILREVGEVLGRTSAGDGDDADRVVHGLMRQIEVCGVDSAVILERLVGELAKSKSAEEEEDEDGEEAVVCQQRQRQQQTVLDWSDV
jgi:hypothetical protein